MDVVALTRQLVDIESITGNEAALGEVLYRELCRLGYQARKMAVEGTRFNVLATLPEEPHPAVVFSTHMDTVPPFIPSSEDEQRIYGRGSCDAKGIIAVQIAAAERLRAEGIRGDAPHRTDRFGTDGAFSVSGTGRVGHRQADRGAYEIARDAAALDRRHWTLHIQYWTD